MAFLFGKVILCFFFCLRFFGKQLYVMNNYDAMTIKYIIHVTTWLKIR